MTHRWLPGSAATDPWQDVEKRRAGVDESPSCASRGFSTSIRRSRVVVQICNTDFCVHGTCYNRDVSKVGFAPKARLLRLRSSLRGPMILQALAIGLVLLVTVEFASAYPAGLPPWRFWISVFGMSLLLALNVLLMRSFVRRSSNLCGNGLSSSSIRL